MKVRKISDAIALEHGLHIIENPRHKNTMKYNEWLARQNGTSWKAKAAEKIDELILRSDVLSIDDLAEKLREENYNVRLGKYMTIRLESMSFTETATRSQSANGREVAHYVWQSPIPSENPTVVSIIATTTSTPVATEKSIIIKLGKV